MDDGSRPEVVPGERIAFIAFRRGDESPPSNPSVPGQLLKIHAAGRRTIDVEVEPTALSNPIGFFARATGATERFKEYFFYAHGVSTKEDAALLWELLLRSGALNPEKLATGLAAQSDSRSLRIGSILVEEHNVSPDIVQQAVKLQDRRRLRLGELLIEAGWIFDEQLKLALGEQKRRKGKRLDEVLVELGVLSEDVLASTPANKFLLPEGRTRDNHPSGRHGPRPIQFCRCPLGRLGATPCSFTLSSMPNQSRAHESRLDGAG